jgi:hypothetical protein
MPSMIPMRISKIQESRGTIRIENAVIRTHTKVLSTSALRMSPLRPQCERRVRRGIPHRNRVWGARLRQAPLAQEQHLMPALLGPDSLPIDNPV